MEIPQSQSGGQISLKSEIRVSKFDPCDGATARREQIQMTEARRFRNTLARSGATHFGFIPFEYSNCLGF